MNMTVGLNQGNVTVTCRTRGGDHSVDINGMLLNSDSIQSFIDQGIRPSDPVTSADGITTQSVTITLSVDTNETEIICHSFVYNETLDDFILASSDPAFVTIRGMYMYASVIS